MLIIKLATKSVSSNAIVSVLFLARAWALILFSLSFFFISQTKCRDVLTDFSTSLKILLYCFCAIFSNAVIYETIQGCVPNPCNYQLNTDGVFHTLFYIMKHDKAFMCYPVQCGHVVMTHHQCCFNGFSSFVSDHRTSSTIRV